jgi:dienelactone hydrolase
MGQFERSMKVMRNSGRTGAALLLGALVAGCSSGGGSDTPTLVLTSVPAYEAGSATFCVRDPSRGFDPTAGMQDGQRLVIVEAWYPIEVATAQAASAVPAKFGDYFAGDPELLLRTERALLETTGFAPDVVERNMLLAPEQFEVPRGSFRNAPVATSVPSFPVVLYSHGTLQQRFTNDTMAENLARHGYIVLAPEHTGNDALAPLGAFCPDEMQTPGLMPLALNAGGAFDTERREYKGQTFDPFFIPGDPPSSGTINPVEVSLTLDRVNDYRAVLAALPTAFEELGAVADVNNVAIIGYSRGGMHGLVGAELMPEVRASVSFVGGTPFKFYDRDAEAQPLHDALAAASSGVRTRLVGLTKPVLDLIGGEDSRRKATTDVAGAMGVYDMPSADNPSPIVADTFQNRTEAFGALVTVAGTDHFDWVDDPFVVAYRAQGGTTRPGAFDATQSYVLRPLAERQAIRDHYVLALLDVYLQSSFFADAADHRFDNVFQEAGVQVTVRE